MISVIIPLYNKELHISNTINSVLSQTYQDFEIVIVDDGSADKSVKEVKKFEDPRIRLISQPNSGVSVARNRGISEAHGEFVALLDADDAWKPGYLETQFGLTEKYPECEVFATSYEFCDKNGKTTHTVINNLPFTGEDGILSNYFQVASTSHPPICSISIMARRGIFESVGGFPKGIKSGEDLLTWARLAARYKIAYSRKPLAVYNVEGYGVKEKPKRYPAEIDIVGQELLKLKNEFHPQFIDNYISLWHKMRSSIYMRLGIRKKSIKEAFIGLRYNPANYKLFAFICINLLPRKLQPF